MRTARDIEREERQRYAAGLNTATQAYEQSQQALSQGIDVDSLFSRAADSVGAQSKRAMDQMRSSFGARGISPNSGASQGAMNRLAQGIHGNLTGARRDIAIEDLRTRQTNAALNFANAMNLAGYQNSPVSGIRHETAQTMFEGRIAREGIAAQASATRDAAQSNMIGGAIGGLTGLIGGLF